MDLHLDQDYELNPDGSGKVTIHWEGDSPNPDLQGPQFIASEVSNGRGIDAWRDLSCTIEDNRLQFKATAYFKDVAALRFHCQGFHANVLDFAASKDDDGNFVLKTPVPQSDSSEPAPAGDDELRARLPGERAKFAMARDFLGSMMGGLVCTASLQLPGSVARVRNGKKGRPDTVSIRFEGKVVVDLLDRLMTDDALAIKLLRSGKEGPDALLGLLGDDQGPLEVVTKGELAPVFDYEGEVAAAKESFAALAETLNLPKPPAAGPPMGNARILASKLVRETDSDRELNPMGQNYPSITFTVAGELPVGVIKLDEGRMDAAITDAGENLVPDDDWKRRIHFPKMTKDRRTAFFDVDLPLPEGCEGLQEVRGTLGLHVSSGTDEVDLGFKKLEAGQTGKEFGASIERLEPQDEERTTLDLKLMVAMETIESVVLRGAKGEEVPMSQNGYSSSGDECTLTYGIQGPIPKKPKLVARVAKNLQRVDVSFEVRDVDLLGRPRNRRTP